MQMGLQAQVKMGTQTQGGDLQQRLCRELSAQAEASCQAQEAADSAAAEALQGEALARKDMDSLRPEQACEELRRQAVSGVCVIRFGHKQGGRAKLFPVFRACRSTPDRRPPCAASYRLAPFGPAGAGWPSRQHHCATGIAESGSAEGGGRRQVAPEAHSVSRTPSTDKPIKSQTEKTHKKRSRSESSSSTFDSSDHGAPRSRRNKVPPKYGKIEISPLPHNTRFQTCKMSMVAQVTSSTHTVSRALD